MIFEHASVPVVVRPNDLDSLQHVNNAVVLEYLETGRWHWALHNGLRVNGLVIPIVARIEIDYLGMLLPPEVVVRTELTGELDPEGINYRAEFVQQVFQARKGREGDPVGRTQVSASPSVRARVQVAFVHRETEHLSTVQDYWESNRITATP